MSAVLGFLCMDQEQLGFDPTIVSNGDMKYIEIERNGQRERPIIDQLYQVLEAELEELNMLVASLMNLFFRPLLLRVSVMVIFL